MADPELRRFAEAYLAMATEIDYRPLRSGDGDGKDSSALEKEAVQFAQAFQQGVNTRDWDLGIPNYVTNRVLVYVIEAAKCLNSGWNDIAALLLTMAQRELSAVNAE